MIPARRTLRTASLTVLALATLGGCKPPPSLHGGGPNLVGPGPVVPMGVADSSPLMRVSPASGNGSAPPSITPGTRLTFYTTTASFEGDGSNWVPDPDGNWTNPKTGQKMSRSKRGGGGASAGYNVYDVVALDNGSVAMSNSAFGIIDNIAPRAAGTHAMGGSAALGSGMWAQPEALQQIPESSGDDRIVKHPFQLDDGRNIDALWVDSRAGSGHELRVYDLQSGLLVHLGTSTSGSNPEFVAPDENGTPGSFMAFSTLTNVRKITVPWANDATPDWAQSLQALDFAGTQTLAMPGAPQPMVTQLNLKMNLKERGNGWVKLLIESERLPGMGVTPEKGQVEMVTGQSQLNPLWIAPSTLAALQENQAIDHDELLRLDTRVGAKEQGPKGMALGIVHASPAEEGTWLYDMQTGMLVGMRQVNKTAYTTTVFTLKG